MPKIIHFSDSHTYAGSGNNAENTLESIVRFSNERKADHLVFTGDLLDGHGFTKDYLKPLEEQDKSVLQFTPLLAQALQQEKPAEYLTDQLKRMNMKPKEEITDESIRNDYDGMKDRYEELSTDIAKRFHELSQDAYSRFDTILGKSEAPVEALVGNHDAKGMEGIVKNANFQPNEAFGRYFFQTGAPAFIDPELFYEDSPSEYAQHAVEGSPKVMLWHQGPHKTKYFNDLPEWTGAVSSKIHLYGHEHPKNGFHKSYDPETDVFKLNTCAKDGYFGEIDYDDNGSVQEWAVYKIEKASEDKGDDGRQKKAA